MYVRFLCMSLIALSVNVVASSSFAYTPVSLRISAPTLTETLREHLRQTWNLDTPFIHWSFWVDTNLTHLRVEESKASTEIQVQRLSDGQSVLDQIDVDLKEELVTAATLAGVDFHLGQNVLVGLLGSYQNSYSLKTFGRPSINNVAISLSTVTARDTTESFGGGAYLGLRSQTLTLHTAIAAWIGEIDTDDFDAYETRDLFLSAALNQDLTVADDAFSLGWHLSGVWSNRAYGEGFTFENKNSFTRWEAGIRIGYHLPQSEISQIEIFALANANYDTFSDEQSLRYGDTGLIAGDQAFLISGSQERFSFAEEQFGMTVGGGVEITNTYGQKLNLSGQYLDLFRESYEGYSASVHLSVPWTEDLSLSSGVTVREEESIWGLRLEHAL